MHNSTPPNPPPRIEPIATPCDSAAGNRKFRNCCRRQFITVLVFGLAFVHQALPSIGLSPLHIEGDLVKNARRETVILRGLSLWVSKGDDHNKIMWLSDPTSGPRVNAVRLAMPFWCFVDRYSDQTNQTENLQFDRFTNWFTVRMLPLIDLCESRQLYAIIDLHLIAAWGSAVGQDKLEQVWNFIARHPRIRDRPHLLFELFNEPKFAFDETEPPPWAGGHYPTAKTSWPRLSRWIQPVCDAVRLAGAQQIILVAGHSWATGFDGLAFTPVRGTNLGYVLHLYPHGAETWAESLSQKYREGTEAIFQGHLPGFITEFGWTKGARDGALKVKGERGTLTWGRPFTTWLDREHPCTAVFGWVLEEGIFIDAAWRVSGSSNSTLSDDDAFPGAFIFDWFKRTATNPFRLP